MGPQHSSSRSLGVSSNDQKKNERRDTTVNILGGEEGGTTSSQRRERIQSFIHDRNESDKTVPSTRSRQHGNYAPLTSGTSHHHEGTPRSSLNSLHTVPLY